MERSAIGNQTVVLASNNPGKLAEFRAYLLPLGFDLRSQNEFNVPEAAEPHRTFVENALEKARHAARLTGLPALADDSGVCANALGGKPGVDSAYYAGVPKSDVKNNQQLIANLELHSDKSAYYYCALVYLRHADDPQPVIAEGRWDGSIVAVPSGTGGFGYDPYFYITELQCSAAELNPEEKNRRSHRGQALRALIDKLR